MRSKLVGLLAGMALAMVFPAFAQADSVVYMKDGNVWIANPDGSGARQFTLGQFAWHSPSEADDGTVVVAGGPAHGSYGDPGSDLYRFSADGNQIGGAIPTPGTYSTLDCLTYAPSGVRVSFDASKIAYGSSLCSTQEATAYWTPSTATGLDFPNQTLGQQDFYQPQWQDNDHFLVTHAGPTVTDTQSRWFLHNVGDGDDVGPGWYESTMTGTGAQGLIARNGTTFAVFEDDAADHTSGTPAKVHLWLYTAPSLADAEANAWTKRCEIALDPSRITDPLHLSPSFSPDSTRLMWGDDQGVEVISVADLSNNCAGLQPQLAIPGGAEPFYSKGDIRAPAAHPDQPGAPATTGGSGPLATFKVRTKHPHAHHKVRFDARASEEPGGSIVSYRWRFGDGRKGTGAKIAHRYGKRGRYRVTLIVRDAAGNVDKARHRVRVRR